MALKTILIVDDSSLMQAIYAAHLERYTRLGIEIVHAADGTEALRALGARRAFDLILLDRYMPGIDGLEFLSRLRADSRFRGTAVIMLTSEGRPAKISECPKEWIQGYITKPVHAKELHEVIQRLFPEVGRPKLGGRTP